MQTNHRIVEIRVAETYYQFLCEIQNQLHLDSLQEVIELMLDVFHAEAHTDAIAYAEDRAALVAVARDRPFIGG